MTTPDHASAIAMFDDRGAAFRNAVAAASDLSLPVPSCPGWTLFDLVEHIGQRRRFWSAIVAAGPADAPPALTDVAPEAELAVPGTPADVDAWLAGGFAQLSSALADAGPDRGVWAWWVGSQAPLTSRTVARHQVQEIAVHTWDAQLTTGRARPLPDEVATAGVEDFLAVCVSTGSPWPHDPATIDYVVTGGAGDGRGFRITLDGSGARYAPLTPDSPAPVGRHVTGRATASDFVLWFYGRLDTDAVDVEGDATVLEQIIAWDPSA